MQYHAFTKKDEDEALFAKSLYNPKNIYRMDNVGINFDTANLILYGKANSADALDVFGKYVRNTHCKDGFYPTNGRELGEEVALGQGKANMPEVYRKLKALNYDGPFIIEREITGEKQIADIIAARELLLKIEAEN